MHFYLFAPVAYPLTLRRRTEKASSALKQNRKEIALGHLRARRQLEDILVKRSKALENLESTLWTVEHAAGDVEVIPFRPDPLDTRALNAFP